MANVFTKRSNKPRTTTLTDFCGHDAQKHRVYPRILSPTRRANPHPRGLVYQLISQKKPSYGIWHPDFNRIEGRIPDMLKHIGWVNFSSQTPVIHTKEFGKPPEVIYTENTTARHSYCPPSRFPDLVKMNPKQSRYGYTPERIPVKGIVPNLILEDYPPVAKQ